MAVQTLTLGGKRFVIMPEAEYKKLKPKATTPSKASNGRSAKLTKQELGDIAEATRRSAGPMRPYSELRKELGLE